MARWLGGHSHLLYTIPSSFSLARKFHFTHVYTTSSPLLPKSQQWRAWRLQQIASDCPISFIHLKLMLMRGNGIEKLLRIFESCCSWSCLLFKWDRYSLIECVFSSAHGAESYTSVDIFDPRHCLCIWIIIDDGD